MNNLHLSVVLCMVMIPFTFSSLDAKLESPSTVRMVSTTGTDAGTCEFFPCATVQYAINQSGSNDKIQIAAGTYTEAGIVIDENLITIQGEGTDKTIVQATDSPPASNRVFYIYPGHRVMIQDITIRNGYINRRGGGIRVEGSTLDLYKVAVVDNTSNNAEHGDGGGISVYDGGLGLQDCTISNNFASGEGGGIHLSNSSASLLNSTISGNRATIGGAIGTISDEAKNIWLHYMTIYDNSVAENGGGMQLESSFSVYLENSIVAGNNAGIKGPDIFGDIISDDYNLIGNTSDVTFTGTTTHNIVDQDAELGALQNNGGPTLTHALLPSSPAIDAGNCINPLYDQRGQIRPIDKPDVVNVADGCDIGAYEDDFKVNLPLVIN